MKVHTGNLKLSVWFEDIIGMDMDYYIPRFENELVKGSIIEWCGSGSAFDCYLILEYDSVDDMLLFLKKDMKGIQKVMNRNKKGLLPRSDANERKVMNCTCVIGSLADRYISIGDSDMPH